MAESEEELESLLMKAQEESEKVGLKLNIQKTKIMASGPNTSLEIDGETVERMSDFIFLGSRITADGDYSHEIKRRLLLGRKVITNLDGMFKSISSLALGFLYGPALTCVHGYWKNHSLDLTDFCQQINVCVF